MLALFLIQQGEPQTLAAERSRTSMQGGEQTIALGPVASLETIKHLGTNGGGFFNANAAHPFENPTPHYQPGADAADDHPPQLRSCSASAR